MLRFILITPVYIKILITNKKRLSCMRSIQKKWWLSIVFFLVLIFGMILINLWFRPSGSISLYQKMSNADYDQFYNLLNDTYQEKFSEKEYKEIQKVLGESADQINEYSIIKYSDNWLIVNKSPDGKNEIINIKVINHEEITKLEKLIK